MKDKKIKINKRIRKMTSSEYKGQIVEEAFFQIKRLSLFERIKIAAKIIKGGRS